MPDNTASTDGTCGVGDTANAVITASAGGTSYWVVPLTASAADPSILAAADLLRAGKRVAFPTETVYGLGVDAGNTTAVEGVFAAKGRPADNPLIVHIAQMNQLQDIVAAVDAVSQKLIDTFWPGPLTLVLPAKPGAVSPRVTAGLPTVAVRMPAHPTALALIAAAGCPLAAPSANRSGRPSPTRAEHVRDDLDGRIEAILDAGPTGVGLESTVIEVVDGIVHILRPGGITREQLASCVMVQCVADQCIADSYVAEGGSDQDMRSCTADSAIRNDVIPAPNASPKSPGMKYKHYAPRGQLTLVIKDSSSKTADPSILSAEPVQARAIGDTCDKVKVYIQQLIDGAQSAGEKTGVLTTQERAAQFRADQVVACGSSAHPEHIAHELYGALRAFDDSGVTFIIAEVHEVETQGIGAAILNRLSKAAGQRIIHLK